MVSRHGHHRQGCSRLGSNAEGLLRTTSVNVLLVGGVDNKASETKVESRSTATIPSTAATPLSWEKDALKRLERVPGFARIMAKNAVEQAVRESGKQHVSADDFNSVAAKFGMGSAGDDR